MHIILKILYSFNAYVYTQIIIVCVWSELLIMTCNNNIVVSIEHFHLPHMLTGRKKPHEKKDIKFSTLIKI